MSASGSPLHVTASASRVKAPTADEGREAIARMMELHRDWPGEAAPKAVRDACGHAMNRYARIALRAIEALERRR